LLGVPAGEIRLDDRSVAVRVRAPDSVRFNPALLATIPIFSPQTRGSVPLGALATFTPVDTRSELLRENQQQKIAMTADLADRALSAVMSDVKGILAANPPPPGIRLEVGGQYASQQQAFRPSSRFCAAASSGKHSVVVQVSRAALCFWPRHSRRRD
jgi:multidrug efflux pump subunit AcrB